MPGHKTERVGTVFDNRRRKKAQLASSIRVIPPAAVTDAMTSDYRRPQAGLERVTQKYPDDILYPGGC